MLGPLVLHWQRFVIVSVGLAVLAFAIPRAIGDLSILTARPQVGAGEPLAAGPRADAEAASLRDVDQRLYDPDARIRAGVLQLRLAAEERQRPTPQADIERLHGGIADLTVGLARAPANASAWLELAQAHLAIGVAPAALADLDASLAFGRFDPALNLRRAEVALRLWLILQEKDRAMLKEQLRFAWNQDPEKLIELAARDPWTAQTIRSFFAGDSQDITEFDRLLARHVRDAKKAP